MQDGSEKCCLRGDQHAIHIAVRVLTVVANVIVQAFAMAFADLDRLEVEVIENLPFGDEGNCHIGHAKYS